MKLTALIAASLAFFFGVSLTSVFSRNVTKVDVRNSSWSVEQIDGRTPSAFATLLFGPVYRLSGTTGCNPYFGIYSIDGTAVAIHTVSVANGPCDAAAAQQAALLQILRDDPEILTDANGKLSIIGKSQRIAKLAPIS